MTRGSKEEDIYQYLTELCGQVFAKDLKLYLKVSQQIRARPRFLMRLFSELSDNPVSCLLTGDNVFTLLLNPIKN